MSTPIPEFGIAKGSFNFNGYYTAAVDEAGQPQPEVRVSSEVWTVAELANAGSRDHTSIQMVVGSAGLHYLRTGEREDGPAYEQANEVYHGRVEGPLSIAGPAWDDTAANFVLRGGSPVMFSRGANDSRQFAKPLEAWPPLSNELLRGIDFTDSLLALVALQRNLILPRELQPARFGPYTKVGKAAEAQKAADIKAYLRHKLLRPPFTSQNVNQVSILAAL